MPRQSFEQLVADHGRRVLNLAVRILGRSELAQDVHQEVFLSVWRRWEQFDGQVSNWQAYLYRATVRKAIEMAREHRRNPSADLEVSPPVFNERPDGALKAAELQDRLAECLAELPERQAEVFVLSRFEGMGYDAIAEFLGCSAPTVRVHLHRALKTLAERLRDYLT